MLSQPNAVRQKLQPAQRLTLITVEAARVSEHSESEDGYRKGRFMVNETSQKTQSDNEEPKEPV